MDTIDGASVAESRCNMIDVKQRLAEIDGSVLENKIYLKYGLLSLSMYEIEEYVDLVCELNCLREQEKELDKRKAFIPLYKKVFWAQKRKLEKMLKNLQNRELDIVPMATESEMKEAPLETLIYDDKLSAEDNFFKYAENRIRRAILLTNEEIYILNNYPSVYYNQKQSCIGGDFGYRYRNEMIIYKKVNAARTDSHYFSTYSNKNNSLSDQRALLNILAYINGRPNFEFLNNRKVNQKLDGLYQNFDLLDCIRLRCKNYLKSDEQKNIYLELPIIKNKVPYNLIIFKEMPHEGILDLYHASLKQFEPLPRCVFLYRVFEYAASNHYKPIFHPTDYQPEDALNYYITEAMQYNPAPLYFVDLGKKSQELKIFNFFTVLKKEAKKIFAEWASTPYLQSKSKGKIVYLTGRNFTAHGSNGARNMQYDYDKNYLHINNINIVLELVARYVIELLNPSLKGIVERKTEYYMETYKRLKDIE